MIVSSEMMETLDRYLGITAGDIERFDNPCLGGRHNRCTFVGPHTHLDHLRLGMMERKNAEIGAARFIKKKEHQQRHIELAKDLGELMADFMVNNPERDLCKTSVTEFFTWAKQEAKSPTDHV